MSIEDFGKNISQKTYPPIHPRSLREDDGRYFEDVEKSLTQNQWVLFSNGVYKGASITKKELSSGVYEIGHDNNDGSPIFIKKDLIHDTLIQLSGLPQQIIAEINEFWTKEKIFQSLGFLHRRGYLFYGSQGTGKSSLVHEIVDNIIKNDGIVFYCNNPEFFNKGLSLFRKIEPTRKIICVFEDIDAMISKYGESMILSILDGENQISNVCNIASTNYPELLDKRIVGRPRRFDRVYKISNLDDKARRAYLEKKLPKKAKVDEWLTKTSGLSIAQISEVIISVFAFDKKIDEAVTIIRDLVSNKSSSEDREDKIGFGGLMED